MGHVNVQPKNSKVVFNDGWYVKILAAVLEHSLSPLLMEQHFFAFSLIIEGTTEKVFQFIMPLKSIYNRNFGFIEQKMYF